MGANRWYSYSKLILRKNSVNSQGTICMYDKISPLTCETFAMAAVTSQIGFVCVCKDNDRPVVVVFLWVGEETVDGGRVIVIIVCAVYLG